MNQLRKLTDIHFIPKNLSKLIDEQGNKFELYGGWRCENSGLNETLYQESDLGYKLIKFSPFKFLDQVSDDFMISVKLRLCFEEYSECNVFSLASDNSKLSLFVDSGGWALLPDIGHRILRLEYIQHGDTGDIPVCLTLPLKIKNSVNWKNCQQLILLEYKNKDLTIYVKLDNADGSFSERSFTLGKVTILKSDTFNLKVFSDPFKELKTEGAKIPRRDGLLAFSIFEYTA